MYTTNTHTTLIVLHLQVDAIFSPCCSDLKLNQGGVSNAILKAGGTAIKRECNTKAPNGIKAGEVLVTTGGQLKCQYVLHGVYYQWSDGHEKCKKVRDIHYRKLVKTFVFTQLLLLMYYFTSSMVFIFHMQFKDLNFVLSVEAFARTFHVEFFSTNDVILHMG